jgi:hypothetical protein
MSFFFFAAGVGYAMYLGRLSLPAALLLLALATGVQFAYAARYSRRRH